MAKLKTASKVDVSKLPLHKQIALGGKPVKQPASINPKRKAK